MVRRGQRRYFYRSIRARHGVIREYVGSGEAADRAAAEMEQHKAERQAPYTAAQEETTKYAELIGPAAELSLAAQSLLKATLTSLGFHQHRRGAWRRRRHANNKHVPFDQDLQPRAESAP
jgi:hypothetical protein